MALERRKMQFITLKLMRFLPAGYNHPCGKWHSYPNLPAPRLFIAPSLHLGT
jgi:hypothetical protein